MLYCRRNLQKNNPCYAAHHELDVGLQLLQAIPKINVLKFSRLQWLPCLLYRVTQQ